MENPKQLAEKYDKSLFISHSSDDKERIWPIVEYLIGNGISLWVDALEMRPGDKLFRRISQGIESSKFIAVMLTPTSVTSKWVEEEVRQALSNEFYDDEIHVIPCMLEECEVPRYLRDRIYCDFRANIFRGICDLLKTLYREYHIIPLHINKNNPLRLNEKTIRKELKRIFCLTKGIQKLYFVIDPIKIIDELESLWQLNEDKLKKQKKGGVEDAFVQRIIGCRRAVPYGFYNLSIGLNSVASVTQEYIGRSATLIDDIIEGLQRTAFFVLYDIWSAVRRSTDPEQFKNIKSIEVEHLISSFKEIESLPSGNRTPTRQIEQHIYDCSDDDLIDIGLRGTGDIFDSRLDIPKVGIPDDTRRQYLGSYPLSPDSKIFRALWLKYFVPGIARHHLMRCSGSGQYLGHYLGNFSVRKEDYFHFGLS